MSDIDTRQADTERRFASRAAMSAYFNSDQPQDSYRKLLDEGGFVVPGEGVFLAGSRECVGQVLRNPEEFSARDLVQFGNIRPLIPLALDPPDQTKYRKILDPLFSPKKMDALDADLADRVNRFIDTFVDRGECHFTDEFAVPFPSAVFLGLMGLPWEELPTLLGFKDGLLHPGGPTATLEDRSRIQAETGQQIYAYFNAALDQREKAPREDILSSFLTAEVEGDRLTREEILDICYLFLVAGLDTVTDTLTCFFKFLAENPSHREQILADETVIPDAVEELLRWETPVTKSYRKATGSGEIAGCPYKPGDLMTASLGAANLDSEIYSDPYVVRFDRGTNPHIAFGAGVHRCLGSHLARRELRIALREWHRRIPQYRIKPGSTPEFAPGLRFVTNLELEW